ncbi:MAG: hypothetical protein K0R92_3184, partial [Lachnospiraceae bacterium]|nr:hypothetical protein [Lachnospiraceae bacterium]
RKVNFFGMSWNTVAPPVSQKVIPARIVLVPRVVIKDSILNFVTSHPLIHPMMKQRTIGVIKQIAIGIPATASLAATTPPKLAKAPTDKSNSLTLIAKVAPKAMITKSDICFVILIKFDNVKNASGRNTLNIITTTIPAIIVP